MKVQRCRNCARKEQRDDGHITPGMAAGSRSRNGAIYRGFNLCLVHSAHYKRGDTMNGKWTQEEILEAVIEM